MTFSVAILANDVDAPDQCRASAPAPTATCPEPVRVDLAVDSSPIHGALPRALERSKTLADLPQPEVLDTHCSSLNPFNTYRRNLLPVFECEAGVHAVPQLLHSSFTIDAPIPLNEPVFQRGVPRNGLVKFRV
jgi:hypothetical protein